jgi:hypothetical protein
MNRGMTKSNQGSRNTREVFEILQIYVKRDDKDKGIA